MPREWRDTNHWLRAWSRYYSSTPWSRTYRASGKCSCGQLFGGEAGDHTMVRDDVIEAWKDHVEKAYYEGNNDANH